MALYRNTKLHPLDLANGGIVPVKATTTLNAKDASEPHNAALIADGALLEQTIRKATSKVDDKKAEGDA